MRNSKVKKRNDIELIESLSQPKKQQYPRFIEKLPESKKTSSQKNFSGTKPSKKNKK